MKFNCPICDAELKGSDGNQIHPGNDKYGVMLHCPNKGCTAEEVMGHGDNLKQAFEVIFHKYKK